MAEPLDAQEVTLGDTTFQIRKLLPMEAFRLFEVIRPALQDALRVQWPLSSDNEQNRIAMYVAFAATIPPDIVETARRQCFKHVFYKAHDAPTPQPLESQEDMAFKNLEAVHIYEVLVRSLYLNFVESWGVLKSLLPQLEQLFPQSGPETSPTSSQTP